MRISRLIIIASIGINILLTACTSHLSKTPSGTDVPIVEVSQPTTPKVEVITPRSYPTWTPIPEPTWGSVQCSDQGFSIYPPEYFGFEGSIIYWDSAEREYFTLGGMPLERNPFMISEEYSIIGFSNSGSHIAFNNFSTNSMEIFDVYGTRWQISPTFENLGLKLEPTIDHYLFDYVSWLGDSALFVQVYPVGDGEQHRPYPAILDIKSGDWIDLWITTLPASIPTYVAIPSPNLQYFAYLDADLSVWSVKDASRIWASHDYDHSIYFAQGHGILRLLLWAPTSKMFAYTSHDSARQKYDRAWTNDVYLVELRGDKESRITNLSDYPAIVSSLLAWSPDGRYLALNASTGTQGYSSFHLYLLIYDTFKQDYAYSCYIPDAEYISALVWSHSSDSFVFYTSCNNFECPKPLRYGEVTSGIMYTLEEDIGHLGQGWSLIDPTEFGEP